MDPTQPTQPAPTIAFGTKLATIVGVIIPVLTAIAAAIQAGSVTDWRTLIGVVVAAIAGQVILGARTSQANALVANAGTLVVTAPEPDDDIPDDDVPASEVRAA